VARIESIQPKINKGFGKVGSILGQTFNVYRLNAKSTGSLAQPSNLIAQNIKMVVRTWTSHLDREAHYIIAVPLFKGSFDPTRFRIGDLFVEDATQRYTDGTAFTYAYFRPLRTFLLVHTPIPATITRSEPNPAKLTTGLVPYQGMNKSREQILVLNNGNFSWAASGFPASVYLGLQSTNKQGELPRPDLRLPTDVPRQSWHVYTPLLPGVQLMESDIVNAANGDRYFISVPFVQSVGLQGWQLVCQKLRV